MYKLKLLEILLVTNFKKLKITITNINCINYTELIKLIKNEILIELNEFKLENLYFKNNIPMVESVLNQYISDDKLEMIYKNIVYPECAKIYSRIDGLTFFFHTNENNHKFYPHIHVRYGEEEIAIGLKNFKITGHMKNKNKVKFALQYTIKNSKKMLEEWNNLI